MEKAVVLFLSVAAITAGFMLIAEFTLPPIPAPDLVMASAGQEISLGAKDLPKLCFPNSCIAVEIADSPGERQQGLMYREELGNDAGMLFVFEQEGIYSFWMKNTLIPLDIIWVGENMEIVHIEHAVPCTTENCQTYGPGKTAKYVVEVNAGYAERKGIQIGDRITID